MLELPHWERHQWCEQISTINERMNDGDGGGPSQSQSESILGGGEGTVIRNSLEDL